MQAADLIIAQMIEQRLAMDQREGGRKQMLGLLDAMGVCGDALHESGMLGFPTAEDDGGIEHASRSKRVRPATVTARFEQGALRSVEQLGQLQRRRVPGRRAQCMLE